ncbi:helix-turn-helix domain-containing protein [Amycolatopsis magusensis]|uniref:helix-turn-helix domain-containing protein n=1 Tax=Amycolatopsis magusensis TaxID=882444 RepID=UPI00379787F0
MSAELPEPAAVVQAWLNQNMSACAPTIRVREDKSLFVEGEPGLLEACTVPSGKTVDGSPETGQLFCLNSAGERRYYRPAAHDSAVVVASKPAGGVVWRFERWQDGALDLVTDIHSVAFCGPGASDPEVDSVLLRWLWPQPVKVHDDALTERLGVSMRTVRRRAAELGLPRQRFDALKAGGDRDVLVELWADPGLTKRAIAQRLGIKETELATVARRWKLPARPRVIKAARRTARSVGSSQPRGSSAGLRTATQRRSEAALESMLERTRAALTLPEADVPQHWRRAGQLRVENPELSLAELADLAGCSKDTITGRLRRLWKLANQVQTQTT